MTDTKTGGKRTSTASKGFTAEEKSAMRERAKELKAQERKEDSAKACLDALAAMTDSDRTMGERVHAIATATDAELSPTTWYGMPAYARDGKIICFFQAAAKFKARYATFGFSEDARIDEGNMWPTSWALAKLTPAEETRIAELVKNAVS